MTAPTGYDLLLPPGWLRVPLDRTRARRFVRYLVAARAAGQPSDSVAPVRMALEREVLASVDRAADAGVRDLFLLSEQRHGLPVAASLTVTEVPVAAATESGDLAGRLGESGTETTSVTLPCGPAVRMERVTAPGPVAPEPGDTAPPVPSVVVEYVVAVPGPGPYLLLTFSSPTLQVREAMVALFDALAGTLRWRWPGAG